MRGGLGEAYFFGAMGCAAHHQGQTFTFAYTAR